MCGLGPRANDAAGKSFTIAQQDAQFDDVIHGTGDVWKSAARRQKLVNVTVVCARLCCAPGLSNEGWR
jgi:hypothetical protein